MIKTRLTELVGLKYPIIQAGMGPYPVTSLCIASGAPATTALRWINLMIERGLLLKVEDDVDRRRAFVSLSEPTADAMARYFEAVKDDLKWLD